MKNLNDWSVADLLALHQRLEANVAVNPEPMFGLLYYTASKEWRVEPNADGENMPLTEAEAKLIMFFAGREYQAPGLLIHLYSISGHFRTAIKAKVDEAIPAPPDKWYRYINAFRTNWTPEEKEPKKAEAKPSKVRASQKINEFAVPFPNSNSFGEEPPF